MSRCLFFTVPGNPVGKERARGTASCRHYTPKKTREYEKLVAWHGLAARMKMQDWPNAPQKKWFVMEYWLFFANGVHPDADNVCKALEDGLQGVIWVNDRKVMGRPMGVNESSKDPRVVVSIREAKPHYFQFIGEEMWS